MERFVTRHRDRIVGILSGFDRMLFRGTLRSISYGDGLDKFLSSQHVLYKDFATYVQRLSDRLKTHAMATEDGQLPEIERAPADLVDFKILARYAIALFRTAGGREWMPLPTAPRAHG